MDATEVPAAAAAAAGPAAAAPATGTPAGLTDAAAGLAQTPPAAGPETALPVDALPAPAGMTGGLPAETLAPHLAPAGGPVDVAASILPHDLSPVAMFLSADWVVQAVMIGLGAASVATWTIALYKVLELSRSRRRVARGLRRLASAPSLEDAAREIGPHGPVGTFAACALAEAGLSAALPAAGIKERAESALGRLEAGEARRIALGTGLLATIGSTAPFIGLFGTVWGIMNSFIGIAAAKTTNLAVVAPGIAEALLATAVGLIAAIPAVMIYNHFARGIGAYRAELADASAAVMRLLSRDLDRAAGRAAVRPAAVPLGLAAE